MYTFVLIWRKVPHGRIDSFPIIKACDVLQYALSGLLARLEFFQIDEFLFEHTVERFDACIIVAIAFAAHAALHAIFVQPRLVVVRGVWTASIRMVQDFTTRSLLVIGSIQSP